MKNILIGLILLTGIQLSAQEKMSTHTESLQSIDGIVNEILNVISGEKGKIRDWEYFRSLFLPTARFTILYHSTDPIPLPYETVNLDEFIELMNDQYYDEGFTEYELGKVVEEYNGIANVFQSFYTKDSEDQEGRGITSYQLLYFNERWWIANVLWTTDSNGDPIPDKYLQD